MNRPPGTPMRVLFVNHVAEVSGAELSLLGLLSKIDRGRFEPIVACPAGPLAERVARLGVRHVPVRLGRIRRAHLARSLLRVASQSLRLKNLLRREGVALVHANSTTAFVYAASASRSARVPAIWHVRDLVELGRAGPVLFRRADAVVCISEAVRSFMSRCADDPAKLRTIHSGIDVSAFRASARPGAARKEFGIDENTPLVAMIAQITPWKGHEFLLDSLPRVIERFPSLRVLIVGEPLTAEDARWRDRLVKTAAAPGLRGAVTFTGRRDDVASIISDCDLVAIPSHDEPFGRVAVEALALGRPVVGTHGGGLPEIVRDGVTGLLVDHGDVQAFSDAILRLMSDPALRRKMGDAGVFDAGRFDLARTVEQVETLYDEITRGT